MITTNSNRDDLTIQLKDGRKLGYAEYGHFLGKPLFFFHGWPGSRLHAKRLSESAYKLKIRLISIDRPGFGLSDFKSKRTLLINKKPKAFQAAEVYRMILDKPE